MGGMRDLERKKMYEAVERLAAEAVLKLGMELVDVQFKTSREGYHITVYIDKTGGVFLEDCELVSKSLGSALDLHDPVPVSYVLEVSSPGPERPLKKKEDFFRFQGETVRIKTANQINGSKNFTGLLQEALEESIILKTEKEAIEIHYQDISKANLRWEKGVVKK